MMDKNKKYYEMIVRNWKEAVNYAYCQGKKIEYEDIYDEKACLLMFRPIKRHLVDLLRKYDNNELTDEEYKEIVNDIVDFEHLVLSQHFIRLGKKGIYDYIKYGATELKLWNEKEMHEFLETKKNKMRVLTATPEELKKEHKEKTKKLREAQKMRHLEKMNQNQLEDDENYNESKEEKTETVNDNVDVKEKVTEAQLEKVEKTDIVDVKEKVTEAQPEKVEKTETVNDRVDIKEKVTEVQPKKKEIVAELKEESKIDAEGDTKKRKQKKRSDVKENKATTIDSGILRPKITVPTNKKINMDNIDAIVKKTISKDNKKSTSITDITQLKNKSDLNIVEVLPKNVSGETDTTDSVKTKPKETSSINFDNKNKASGSLKNFTPTAGNKIESKIATANSGNKTSALKQEPTLKNEKLDNTITSNAATSSSKLQERETKSSPSVSDKSQSVVQKQDIQQSRPSVSNERDVVSTVKNLQMDEEYMYIINILLQVKEKNRGVTLTEEQILEKAVEIDPKFAIKYFKRTLRITPFCEIINLRPTGYTM